MKMNDAPEKGKPLDDSMLENVTGGDTPAEKYYSTLCQIHRKDDDGDRPGCTDYDLL